MWADGFAVSASDAVGAVRFFINRDVEFASFSAGSASRAFFLVDFEAVERNFVEHSVNGSERTHIPAERTVYYNRRKKRDEKNRDFPPEQESGRPPHRAVQEHERHPAFQRPDRADEFAEPRLAKPCKVGDESRQEQDENAEENEAQIAEVFLSRKLPDFLDERDFEEQILHEAERAQKTADEPAEETAEDDEETDHIHRNAVLPGVQRRLQGAYRAGRERARTRIAVHSGDAESF